MNYRKYLILGLGHLENYEEQKIYDDKIKKFADACNKYLSGKKFVYNQSELKLILKKQNEKAMLSNSPICLLEKSRLSLCFQNYIWKMKKIAF